VPRGRPDLAGPIWSGRSPEASAEPPPQLLLLAEPTNNLGMPSAWQLRQALRSYPGTLIVASHDLPTGRMP
jgi:ABC-type lipoprotein export system ATPase subunit